MPRRYTLEPSPVKIKKMRAWFVHNGKRVHVDFGHKDYEDFTQHHDPKRKSNYLMRSAGIRDKSGQLTKDNPLSPNYWARRILWDSKEAFVGI